ncbi:hypothetical protein SSBR45G_40940 [Bradyrhizobium sp. SSBR45G]|uniref:hypothetical protein n=1 Tax=unclassified Bradyrhizobium TaxID=2631580 RepID=UPI00234291CC|nr:MULTISPECIES: hypothetical protein [unclassified Bradyrhizobium]GLH79185.1 hypothetical protein SSBR45G_40940 [Bradyrhizobium sp. SSBR45G]GLH84620.1 hypothetical protein SSBR45R_20800 [Bradyrhizobium sp. SSBR45R]
MNTIIIPAVALTALAVVTTNNVAAPVAHHNEALAAHGTASSGPKPIVLAQTGCSSRSGCR